MASAFEVKASRILSAFVILLLSFMIVAALAVVAMLAVTSVMPDGAIGLLHLSPDVARQAAIVATPQGRAAVGAVAFGQIVVLAIVLLTLLRLLRSATRGTPFVAANVSRLRLIAAVYAVSLVARFVVPLVVPLSVADWLHTARWSFNVADGGALLIALVLAEVFREGIRLREDHDATV